MFFLGEWLLIWDSCWVKMGAMYPYIFSELGLHLPYVFEGSVYAATVLVSSYSLPALLHLEGLDSLVSSSSTGFYNLSTSSSTNLR